MTTSPDPALAIQEHRILNTEWFRLCMELDEAEGTLQRLPPRREDARIACATDAVDAAAERVAATKPTTAAGAAALIRYVIENMEDQDDDTSGWPVSLLSRRNKGVRRTVANNYFGLSFVRALVGAPNCGGSRRIGTSWFLLLPEVGGDTPPVVRPPFGGGPPVITPLLFALPAAPLS